MEVSVDGGSYQSALVVPGKGGVSLWRKELTIPQGRHPLTVRATDTLGNVRTAAAAISVELPLEPGDVDQIFEPTRYLQELLDFAKRYVDTGDPATPLSPAVLTKRIHRPSTG